MNFYKYLLKNIKINRKINIINWSKYLWIQILYGQIVI